RDPGADRAEAGRERTRRRTVLLGADGGGMGARPGVGPGRALVPPAAETAAAVVVRAVDVHKRFGRLHVLNGVDLTVGRGETVCVIGASGSGKTTFLRCINHLEKIDSGRIEVNGHLIGYRERNGSVIEDSERNI